MLKKLLLSFAILIFASFQIFSQSNELKEVWKYIYDNDYENSLKLLDSNILKSSNKEEAIILRLLVKAYTLDLSNINNDLSLINSDFNDPNPYIFGMWNSVYFAGRPFTFSDDYAVLFENLLKDKRLNSVLKAYITEQLAKYYVFKNNQSIANKYYSKLGIYTNWQIAGVFENISESGFNKEYEPITHPESDAKFYNKIGAEVRWFTIPEYLPGKWINIASHYDIINSIAYCQSFIESPSDQTVEIRIGTSGSLKFWLNDALVISESEERNNGIDTYIAKVKLNKGYNRCLLQLGSSEISNMNFTFRTLDLQGNILNMKSSASYQAYSKSDKMNVEVQPQFAEEFFLKKIETDPENILNYLLLIKTYQMQDKNSKALHFAKIALEKAPKCGLILSALLECYIREDDDTQQSIIREEIKKNDPNSSYALNYKFMEFISAKKYDEASAMVPLFEKYCKNEETVVDKKIISEFIQNNIESGYNQLVAAYKKFPENLSFTSLLYYSSLENAHDYDPEKILKDYLSQGLNTNVINMLADYYIKMNNTDKALKVYDDYLINFYPETAVYYNQKGDILFSARRYKEALEQYNKASDNAPYISFIYNAIGSAHRELGNKELAINSFKKSIALNPQNYFARNEYRKLLDKKRLIELNPEPDYNAIAKSAPTKADFPDDNSAILLDESIKVAYYGGGSETKSYYMVKVFNSAGIDYWKEYEVPIAYGQDGTIEKAEIIKKNGQIVKAETDDTYVVFTNLEADDVILIVYKTEDYQSGTLIKHFWEDISFTYGFPCLKSKYTLVTEKGVNYDKVQLNSNIEPTVIENDDYKAVTWEKTNIKATRPEAYMPPFNDIAERVFISTIPDWDFVSKWYVNLSASKAKSNDDVKEVISRIFPDGYSTLSDREKAVIIYHFITKEINYSSVPFRQSGLIPQKASKTIITKMGDCKDVSTLFVALCKEVGLNAGIALIELKDNGNKSMLLPTISFEHAIAYVNINGEKHYIELTSDNLPFGTIFGGLENSNALDVNDSKNKKNELFVLNPDNKVPNEVHRFSKVTFESNLMKVVKNNIKTGGLAAAMRYIYRDQAQEEREKDIQASIAYDYPKVKLTYLKIDNNIDDQSDSVTYHYNYDVDEIFTNITNLSIFKLPWGDVLKNNDATSQNDRKFDISIDEIFYSDLMHEKIELQLPAELELVELPQNINLKNTVADYSITYSQKGNTLIAERFLKKKKSLLKVGEFEIFKSFYQKIIKSDENQVVLKVKSTEPKNDKKRKNIKKK